jgi:hypothetical protein
VPPQRPQRIDPIHPDPPQPVNPPHRFVIPLTFATRWSFVFCAFFLLMIGFLRSVGGPPE